MSICIDVRRSMHKILFCIVMNFVRTLFCAWVGLHYSSVALPEHSLSLPYNYFAYTDKYICTCLLIKVIGPGSANFVYVDE